MVKSLEFFFQSYYKCFISEMSFRFGQILFNQKRFVPGFLRSILITYYFDNLESGKRNYCFGKKVRNKS